MKISYEFRIGILATLTIIILIFGYRFLKGNNLLDSNKKYSLIFDDVDQLEPASPVFTRGIKVGTVLKIQLAKDNPDKVVVQIDVKGDLRIPKNAKAVLVSTGIIGGKAIDIRYDHHCTEDCIPENGYIDSEVESILNSMLPKSEIDDYIQTVGKSVKQALDSSGKNGQLNAISNDLRSTIHHMNLITIQLNDILVSNSKQLTATMSNLNALTKVLASNSKNIDQSLSNLNAISTQLKESEMGKILSNSNQSILSLQKTAQDASASLRSINELIAQIQNGNGTASKFIKDPSLYNNLESTSKNLDKLLIDLRQNPTRYVHFSVFGDKKNNSAEGSK